MEKEIPLFNNYRELVEYSTEKYKNNIAYKYKENIAVKPPKYIEKTYGQVGRDIKALATSFLNSKIDFKRVALISDNRYEWVISYYCQKMKLFH